MFKPLPDHLRRYAYRCYERARMRLGVSAAIAEGQNAVSAAQVIAAFGKFEVALGSEIFTQLREYAHQEDGDKLEARVRTSRRMLLWVVRRAWVDVFNADPLHYPEGAWKRSPLSAEVACKEKWPLEPNPDAISVPTAPTGEKPGSYAVDLEAHATAGPKRTYPSLEQLWLPEESKIRSQTYASPTYLKDFEKRFMEACSKDVREPKFDITAAVRSLFTNGTYTATVSPNQLTQEETTMKLLTTAPVVEFKTFINGRELSTFNDDQLLELVVAIDNHIEQLRDIKTPLAKVEVKIAELQAHKQIIVDLLGGAPVVPTEANPVPTPEEVKAQAEEVKPRRRRTTQAEQAPAPAEPKVEAEVSAADIADLSDPDLPTGPSA